MKKVLSVDLDSSSSTASTAMSLSRQQHDRNNRPSSAAAVDEILSRAISGARILFIFCLLCVAVSLGFVAHKYLTEAETQLAENQFESIADRALAEALRIAQQKRWATVTMASIISEFFPDAQAWPFVAVSGFEMILGNLLKTSSSVNMAFAPFVLPEQLAEWEDYIYDFYENTRNPPLPNSTAFSSFGRGVWAFNPFLGTSD
jgi:hypothetical protein